MKYLFIILFSFSLSLIYSQDKFVPIYQVPKDSFKAINDFLEFKPDNVTSVFIDKDIVITDVEDSNNMSPKSVKKKSIFKKTNGIRVQVLNTDIVQVEIDTIKFEETTIITAIKETKNLLIKKDSTTDNSIKLTDQNIDVVELNAEDSSDLEKIKLVREVIKNDTQIEVVQKGLNNEIDTIIIKSKYILKLGHSGELVRVIQELLNLKIDGEFGLNTTQAVIAFQKENKLEADGIVGLMTWKILGYNPLDLVGDNDIPSGVTWIQQQSLAEGEYVQKELNNVIDRLIIKSQYILKLGHSGELVRVIQELLNLKVDGEFGLNTTQAVIDFQKENELEADGIVGLMTWKVLDYNPLDFLGVPINDTITSGAAWTQQQQQQQLAEGEYIQKDTFTTAIIDTTLIRKVNVPKVIIKEKRKKRYSFGEVVDKNSSEKARFFLERAKLEINKGNLNKAKEYIENSLKLNPSNADTYILKGDVYANLDILEKAIVQYHKASILEPNNAQLLYNIGNCFLQLGKDKNATEEWTKALIADSTYIMAYVGRASLYLKEKKYDSAIADYNKIFSLNNYFYPAYRGRGVANLELGNYQLAIEDFNKFLEYEPTEPFTITKRGMAKLFDNDIFGGCTDILKASEMGYEPAKKELKKHCER